MTGKSINKKLSEYNSIIKENEEIYHKIARKFGLSDCAFWILYTMCEEEDTLTQTGICDALYQPKQTVNSALKKLEKDGYIELETIAGCRSKQINFTEKGSKFVDKTVGKVIANEQKALLSLTLEEQEMFIGLFHKYTNLLKNNINSMEDW